MSPPGNDSARRAPGAGEFQTALQADSTTLAAAINSEHQAAGTLPLSCAQDAGLVRVLLAQLDAVWDDFAGSAQIDSYVRDNHPEHGYPNREAEILWPLLVRFRDFVKAERAEVSELRTEVQLRPNNCTFREPCGACGQSHKDAETPLWIFTPDNLSLCGLCAEFIAPQYLRIARDVATLCSLTDDKRAHRIVERIKKVANNFGVDHFKRVRQIIDAPQTRTLIAEVLASDTARHADDGAELPF